MKDYALFFAMALGLSGSLTAQQGKPSDDYTKDAGLKTSRELTRILKSESFTPESLVVLRKTVTASSDHRLNTIRSGLDKFIKDQPTSDDVLLLTDLQATLIFQRRQIFDELLSRISSTVSEPRLKSSLGELWAAFVTSGSRDELISMSASLPILLKRNNDPTSLASAYSLLDAMNRLDLLKDDLPGVARQ